MRSQIAVLTVILTALGPALWAKDDDKAKAEAERLQTAAEVLGEIMGAPEEGIPSELLARAECVVVVPGLKKGAIGIGGRFGRGAVSCRRGADHAGAWGSPSMLTVAGGSFGLQLGGSSTDVVMLVMNKKGAQHLLKSKFTLGGDASAAAGPKGRSAAAATDATMRAEILTYSRARGLFAGVSLDGASVRPDNDANQRLYGQRVDPKALLIDGKLGIPDAARPFAEALAKHAPTNVSAK